MVLGQVMSENDPLWSAFWVSGTNSAVPPTPTALVTGKMVGEDPTNVRLNETIGFVVFETGHGTIGGVEFEAAVGPVTVRSIGNSPPYSYNFLTPFATTSSVALASQAAMDGTQGSWAYLHGSNPITATGLDLALDEDQVGDPERRHVPEPAGYVVFAGPVVYPGVPD